jgi:predicted NBD/HSP70 family sugar kinase
MTINYDGPACSCGGHGCFELYASATGLTNLIAASKDAGRQDFLGSSAAILIQ